MIDRDKDRSPSAGWPIDMTPRPDELFEQYHDETAQDRSLPSGWWILPGAVLGALIWVFFLVGAVWVVWAFIEAWGMQ